MHFKDFYAHTENFSMLSIATKYLLTWYMANVKGTYKGFRT